MISIVFARDENARIQRVLSWTAKVTFLYAVAVAIGLILCNLDEDFGYI